MPDTLLSVAQKLAEVEKELEDFAYGVSHDLNAPLRHIKCFTELLIDNLADKLGEDDRELAAIVVKSVVDMEAMLSALLQYSRLGSEFKPVPGMDAVAIVRAVVEEFQRTHQVCTIELSAAVDVSGLLLDGRQLATLLQGLLDNALQFCEAVEPTITIAVVQAENCVRLSVVDQGIGIDPKFHAKIFSMFYQVDPDRHKAVGSGLAIAKKIMRLHGGDLYRVEQDVGGRFVCEFPIDRSQE